MRRLILLPILFFCLFSSFAGAEEEKPKWPGIDETVVEKYAGELGREARAPYINTDQGDLLLFVFALAGAVGGFIIGFYWHKVFVAGKKDGEDGER